MTDAQKIRQLERQLTELEADPKADIQKKIDLLNDLAWALSDTDMKRAYALAEKAYKLANAPDDGVSPYQVGIAYSLRTQGYLNQRFGDYPLGLTQLFKAQGMLESLALDDGLADTFDGIAGIYFQIGNFPETLDYIFKQLEVAQRIGDKRRIANAYNNLANIYFETGEYKRAIETLDDNLQIAVEIDYKRIEFLSYANLAETHLLTGNYEKALENALRGLRVSQEAGFELFEVYSLDLIGKTYLKLGNATQAIHYLEKALGSSRKVRSKVTESLILLNLGQAYRNRQQIDLALDYLRQGIKVAESIKANSELFKGHLALSDLYEQQGDIAQALHHFKQHQMFKELVSGEKADQRLKVLQVAHDTETAQKEAEIAHLRTVELQQEIDKQSKMRTQLQRQVDYERALALCSQVLLSKAETEAGQQQTLNQALEHLRVGSQASRAYIFRNIQDPDLGPCLGIVAEACASGIEPQLPNPKNQKAPWTRMPAIIFEMLQAGEPIGGPVETLFANLPDELELYRNQIEPLLSLQCFPIFIRDQWWGFVGFDDCLKVRQWGEQEIRMLGTASEMIASTLQRWQAEEKLQRQLSYARALSACSSKLLSSARSEDERHVLLAQALQYLIEPTGASSIYLFENEEDTELGFAFRISARVNTPGMFSEVDISESLATFRQTFLQSPNDVLSAPFYPQTEVIPWSISPAEIYHQLASGNPVGGLTRDLFKDIPLWQEYLLNEVHVLSIQFFPVFLDDHWWGTVGLLNHSDEYQWAEDELLLLGATAELITSSLKLWRAEEQLLNLNEQLEQRVEERTAELSKTIAKLEKEVARRKQAELEIQQMVELLEQRVADRSRELAALYDMTILFTEAQNLTDILTPALSNICNSVDGDAIAVHILDADNNQLQLAAQLSLRDWDQLQQVALAPVFADWLQQADGPEMLVGFMDTHPVLPPEILPSRYQTYFSIALRVRKEVIGLLGVYREQERPFSVQNVSFLITMAEQLGIIIQNHRLQEQSRYMVRVIERQQLARELHDSVAQRIYSLNLFAHAGQEAAEDGDLDNARLRLQQVEENALYALREMRLLLYQLRPLALEVDTLEAAFEKRFELVERRLGIEAMVQTDSMPILSDNVEEELFYIISEALNNSLKHAQATRVELRFEGRNDQLLITIWDNGRGFDSQQQQQGLGLENLFLRTTKINGLIDLETAVGQGTTIRLTI